MAEEKTLHEKLVEIQQEIGFVEFDKTNSGMGYGYASAAGMIRKFNKALSARGLIAYVTDEQLTNQGEGLLTCRLELTVSDGMDRVKAIGTGGGKDKGDKAAMKASTAAYKYALAHLFALGWGAEDPEADETTDKPAAEEKPKKARGGRKPKAESKPEESVDIYTAIETMTGANKRLVAESLRAQKENLDAAKYEDLVAKWKAKDATLRAA